MDSILTVYCGVVCRADVEWQIERYTGSYIHRDIARPKLVVGQKSVKREGGEEGGGSKGQYTYHSFSRLLSFFLSSYLLTNFWPGKCPSARKGAMYPITVVF